MPASLKGLSILITRPRAQAIELAGQLEELGAEPIVLPCINIAPLPGDFDLEGYDWLVFTSVNGVEVLTERHGPTKAKVAAIGSATAAALTRAGWPVDVVPERFISDEIADHLGEIAHKRILVVQGDRARTQLPEILRLRGAKVEYAVVYRIADTHPTILAAGLRRLMERGLPDAITFTSPSAVQALTDAARASDLEAWLKTIPIVCIGPVTAEEVERRGLMPTVVADEFTIPGLVEALGHLAVRVA